MGVDFLHEFVVHMVYLLSLKRGHYCMSGTSPSIGLRRGCGLSLSICFGFQLALVAGFRRVSSLAFSLVHPIREYFIYV